ncbi:hypothetical protein TELCIR_07080 [Teladorsagia circumcincta]|uniref:G protein-coupled receptor n=1 Tax=Teladorsagia circumcincta TaxID=45464 RepID=A0A2G9ULK6_TELCI|nr:hypothetical protein TELCIR_07080 [Teladorsagia circumcincta]
MNEHRFISTKNTDQTCPAIIYSFSGDGEAELRTAVEMKFGYNMSSECTTLPIAPVYAVILVLRRLIAIKLEDEKTISENSRRLQTQLLQALIVQACLPIFSLFAVIIYAMGQLNIYRNPILEHLTFILLGFTPMLAPLTSLYFIGPYRAWMLWTFLPHKEVISIVSPT